MTRIIYMAAVLVFLIGCAHDARVSRTTGDTTIGVYVDGGVNQHGIQTLDRPFTIEHAIQQAGGLEQFEQDLNRRVIVRHRDGGEVSVRRGDYGSFYLADGDGVFVPRH